MKPCNPQRSNLSRIGASRGRLKCAPANKLPNRSACRVSIVSSDGTYRESATALAARRKSHGTFSGTYGIRSNGASPAAVKAAVAITRGLPIRPAIHPQAASAPMSSTTFRLGSKSGAITIANRRSAPQRKTISVAAKTAHPASAATRSPTKTPRKPPFRITFSRAPTLGNFAAANAPNSTCTPNRGARVRDCEKFDSISYAATANC